MSNIILGGEVKSQFTYGKPEDFDTSIELARVDQEAMCGYPLKVTSVRQTQARDEHGRDVFEVFATFAPVEET